MVCVVGGCVVNSSNTGEGSFELTQTDDDCGVSAASPAPAVRGGVLLLLYC